MSNNNNGVAVRNYTGHGVVPRRLTGRELNQSVQLPAGVVYPMGTVLGQIPPGGSNGTADVQTLTVTGTPSSGSLTLTWANSGSSPAVIIPYNSTAAAAQLLMNAAIGAGNVIVGGGDLPGTPMTFTFYGSWGGVVPVPSVNYSALGGGSSPAATVAQTTPGTNGTAGTAANDTQTLHVSGTPTGGSFIIGFGGAIATIAYNSTAAQTQTALAAMVTIGAGNVAVTGSTFPDNTQTIVFQGACAGLEQPLLTVVSNSLTGGTPVIAINKTITGNSANGHFAAYTGSGGNDGRQIAKCVLQFPCAVDTFGNITYGDTVGTADYGLVAPITPAWFQGIFAAGDLTGIDATAVTQVGRFISGNASLLSSQDTLIDFN